MNDVSWDTNRASLTQQQNEVIIIIYLECWRKFLFLQKETNKQALSKLTELQSPMFAMDPFINNMANYVLHVLSFQNVP